MHMETLFVVARIRKRFKQNTTNCNCWKAKHIERRNKFCMCLCVKQGSFNRIISYCAFLDRCFVHVIKGERKKASKLDCRSESVWDKISRERKKSTSEFFYWKKNALIFSYPQNDIFFGSTRKRKTKNEKKILIEFSVNVVCFEYDFMIRWKIDE